jgi:hypothetical protein
MNEIIQQSEFEFAFTCLDGRLIPNPDVTFEQWKYSHNELLRMGKYLKSYIKQSVDFAVDKFGLEETAYAVAHMETGLGIEDKSTKSGINPNDKSKAIVTIESVRMGFDLWYRKMDPEIDNWDRAACEKARFLVSPIVRFDERLRSKLGEGA